MSLLADILFPSNIFFLLTKCTFSLPSLSLIPIRSHNANMILPKSTCQESYWYFSFSCQGVSYDFPCQAWGRKQTQECKKTSSCGVQLRWQLRWICNSEIKADYVLQHLYPWFLSPQKQFAPTFHQSVFVRGGRASEHPELWPDFVNPLLLDLQGRSTKNNPNSKTTSLWWAEFMLLIQKNSPHCSNMQLFSQSTEKFQQPSTLQVKTKLVLIGLNCCLTQVNFFTIPNQPFLSSLWIIPPRIITLDKE